MGTPVLSGHQRRVAHEAMRSEVLRMQGVRIVEMPQGPDEETHLNAVQEGGVIEQGEPIQFADLTHVPKCPLTGTCSDDDCPLSL